MSENITKAIISYSTAQGLLQLACWIRVVIYTLTDPLTPSVEAPVLYSIQSGGEQNMLRLKCARAAALNKLYGREWHDFQKNIIVGAECTILFPMNT